MSPESAALVAAIRKLGSDAEDLRDAAHEAHHALEAQVPPGEWNRDAISAHVKELGVARAAASELMARAVEQLVCQRLGEPTYSPEVGAFTSCLEAVKFRDPFLSPTLALKAILDRMKSPEGRTAADAVLALATSAPKAEPKRPRRNRARSR